VGIDAHPDGSGLVRATVTLDRDAVAQVPDLASQLRVADLKAAGWRVDGPAPVANGGMEVKASKRFATPAEATVVVSQLSGAEGPFQGFRVRRTRSFAKTRLSFSGTVDLAKGIGSFSDAELRQRLGGTDVGFDPAQLEGRLGRSLSRIFPVRVVARLPGSVSSNAPTRAGNGAQWSPTFGEKVTLTASSTQWNTRPLAAAGLAVVSALALVALAVSRLLRRSSPF
jgi:hypothetical protein